MNLGDLRDIEAVLGIDLVERHAGKFSASIINEDLGTRLRLEVIPGADTVRVYVDRDKRAKPTFVSRALIRDVSQFNINYDRNEVELIFGVCDIPASLIVTKNGTYQLLYGDHKDPAVPLEAKIELVEITGELGWPDFRMVKDGTMPLFKAAVGVPNGDDKPKWIQVIAYRAMAKEAAKFEKRSQVKVTGLFRDSEWTDKDTGEIHTKPVLVLQSIAAA